MRVLFYMHTAQFALSMSLLRELSQLAEVHVLLEVSPAAWRIESFDLGHQAVPEGIVRADPLIGSFFPPGVRAYWQGLASFNLVVHHARQSVRPQSWRVSHAVARSIHRLEPQVIHFDEGSRRMLLTLLELGRRPVVLTIHDPENHSGERHWRAELDRFFFLKRSSRVLLYNQALMHSFASHYSVPLKHIRATQLGVHHIFREWMVGPVPHAGQTVLFYGRLSAYKGLEVLYAAATDVAERVPGVRFVVAGRPAGDYELPTAPLLAHGAQVEVIREYIPNTRLAQLLASASVIVCPYIDATQSGVVLTAFAFEKPVVATRVGGLPEYITDGETGLLVAPRDSAALADALVQVLTNATLQERLRTGVSRLGRGGRLDWASAARATLEVYREVASA
jgi:glycosyltransferase involved in cell wall biosynthesis